MIEQYFRRYSTDGQTPAVVRRTSDPYLKLRNYMVQRTVKIFEPSPDSDRSRMKVILTLLEFNMVGRFIELFQFQTESG